MGLERRNILTPGAKKRLLYLLDQLEVSVSMDQDRDTIMNQAAEIMPAVVNPFAYYEVVKQIGAPLGRSR